MLRIDGSRLVRLYLGSTLVLYLSVVILPPHPRYNFTAQITYSMDAHRMYYVRALPHEMSWNLVILESIFISRRSRAEVDPTHFPQSSPPPQLQRFILNKRRHTAYPSRSHNARRARAEWKCESAPEKKLAVSCEPSSYRCVFVPRVAPSINSQFPDGKKTHPSALLHTCK